MNLYGVYSLGFRVWVSSSDHIILLLMSSIKIVRKMLYFVCFLQANFEVESVTNAQRAGICGNGMCENGERCDSSSKSVTLPGNTTCCLMDCPFVSSTCPVPLSGAGANKSCAGNGICLDASGQCSCFVGVTLPFLQVNVLLLGLNTISWNAVVSVCEPYTQELVSPRTWYSLPTGQEHSITLVFVPVPIFFFNVHGCN